jgi:hypothetical protein
MLKWLADILFPPSIPVTHDFTRGRVEYSLSPNAQGDRAVMIGWRQDVRTGDFIILPNNNFTTRYKVHEVAYVKSTATMFKAYLIFDPRP